MEHVVHPALKFYFQALSFQTFPKFLPDFAELQGSSTQPQTSGGSWAPALTNPGKLNSVILTFRPFLRSPLAALRDGTRESHHCTYHYSKCLCLAS